jgi:hypothetical protein
MPQGGSNVFLTRLHVRYDEQHFPEDLAFQETSDRENFQARYVLRHPWKGEATCDAAREYLRGLPKRQSEEAMTLVKLTGWNLQDVRRKANLPVARRVEPTEEKGWWDSLWD